MADIHDRLDRLQRREDFDRSGMPLRPADPVARPAGVDDRLGEVLDAVAAVVRKHPGLSVMVAVADGRAGRPVVRVTERDGRVETGVVVTSPPVVAPPPAEQAAAVPSTPPEPYPDPAPADGRHAAQDEPARAGRSGGSWHDSLWSAGAQARFRGEEPEADDRLRLVAEAGRPEDGAPPGYAPASPGSTIPLPSDTSQVVSRLAQLLRDNPTLASSWSREAPE